jgi:hypothetical protein
MLAAVERFPGHLNQFARQVTFLPTYQPNVGYVLLQLRAPDAYKASPTTATSGKHCLKSPVALRRISFQT